MDPSLLGFRPLALSLEREAAGHPVEYISHTRLSDAARHRLHRYGRGPFCRIRVADAPATEGVYLVLVGAAVVYVGKCDDIRVRWGPQGYGLISPRNCYIGGQSTNCKVNHLVLEAAKAGQAIELWFRATGDSGSLEAALIRRLRPPWNGTQPP